MPYRIDPLGVDLFGLVEYNNVSGWERHIALCVTEDHALSIKKRLEDSDSLERAGIKATRGAAGRIASVREEMAALVDTIPAEADAGAFDAYNRELIRLVRQAHEPGVPGRLALNDLMETIDNQPSRWNIDGLADSVRNAFAALDGLFRRRR